MTIKNSKHAEGHPTSPQYEAFLATNFIQYVLWSQNGWHWLNKEYEFGYLLISVSILGWSGYILEDIMSAIYTILCEILRCGMCTFKAFFGPYENHVRSSQER